MRNNYQNEEIATSQPAVPEQVSVALTELAGGARCPRAERTVARDQVVDRYTEIIPAAGEAARRLLPSGGPSV
ncbi:MAG: hypothetical protein ACRDQ0_03450 [Pseudonocardia sp.]